MIQNKFIHKSKEILNGFFSTKRLPGDKEKKLKNLIKFCFEPYKLLPEDAIQLSYFNRTSRSSLYPEHKIDYPAYKHVVGFTVVIDDEQNLVAAYFALPSSNVGYRKVYYRRWKGMGFEEAL